MVAPVWYSLCQYEPALSFCADALTGSGMALNGEA